MTDVQPSYRTATPELQHDGSVIYRYGPTGTFAPERYSCRKDREPPRRTLAERLLVEVPRWAPLESGLLHVVAAFTYASSTDLRPTVWVDVECRGCGKSRVRQIHLWVDAVRHKAKRCSKCRVRQGKAAGDFRV